MLRILAATVGLLISVTPTQAQVRQVRAGDDLQAALNAAKPGDELRLQAGATFTGNFVLPVKTGDQPITLRTDLPDADVPPANERVTPQTAARFARIVSPTNEAALRTAPAAHHWRILLLEFPANKEGFGDIIQLGDGSAAQSDLAAVPFEITLDRLYVHGHPLYGQKRGIALNARAVTIVNCYVSDIKTVGADGQAIGGWNGPGPFVIENNYLEASGENFLLGGSDPAIPNLVSEDVRVRYNHLARPMAWRDPIVSTPSGVTARSEAGGNLPDGSYAYRVVARRPVGQGSTGVSLPSEEKTVTASGGAVVISWSPVTDATEYVVYGRKPGGEAESWTTAATTFHDTGAAGKPGALPKEATKWQVKNLFELKNARRVDVEYNLFENNWLQAQVGYAILLTPRNQDGQCPWCVVESIEFSHNVIRNSSAGMNILGYDSPNPSRQTSGIHISDNLFYRITTRLGGNGWGVLIGDAPRDVTFDRNTFDFDGTTLLYAYGGSAASPRPITGFQFTNNAARHGEYGISGADAAPGKLTIDRFFPKATITGNWLSGGSAAKYPGGNRFETPFDAGVTTGPVATSGGAHAAGANVGRLLAMAEAVSKGLMTPQ
jgi:hypothetical protein